MRDTIASYRFLKGEASSHTKQGEHAGNVDADLSAFAMPRELSTRMEMTKGDQQADGRRHNGVGKTTTREAAETTAGSVLGGIDLSSLPKEGPEKRMLRMKILKNVAVVSFGFLLLFTAFQSLSNLQSSVNSDAGLGTASMSVIYAALVLSCMFVPSYMISWLGLKRTLVVSMLMYSTYFFANFYASWYTLIPTSVVLGLGGAPLWTAKCAYLTELAKNYARLLGQRGDVAVTRFFGFFFMVFQSGQIWGNLISSHVLRPDAGNATGVEEQGICGANFCNEVTENNTNLARPPDRQVYLLCGIYSACSLLAAFLIFAFLDPLRRSEPDGSGEKRPPFRLLVETFRHLRHPHQMLLIPLTIYSGLEQAYVAGDFTKAFVSCSWGIHNVGLVMICFGGTNTVCSIGFGQVIKLIGRVPVFLLGSAFDAAAIILMFLWTPNPQEKALFFLVAGLWGAADAIWQTQINTLYGVLFPDERQEAAFANYRLWESLGFIVAFAYSSHLCIVVKLWILVAVLTIGIAAYLAIEVHLWHRRKKARTVPQAATQVYSNPAFS